MTRLKHMADLTTGCRETGSMTGRGGGRLCVPRVTPRIFSAADTKPTGSGRRARGSTRLKRRGAKAIMRGYRRQICHGAVLRRNRTRRYNEIPRRRAERGWEHFWGRLTPVTTDARRLLSWLFRVSNPLSAALCCRPMILQVHPGEPESPLAAITFAFFTRRRSQISSLRLINGYGKRSRASTAREIDSDIRRGGW